MESWKTRRNPEKTRGHLQKIIEKIIQKLRKLIFWAVFLYIWPLAGPNIAEKGWPLLGKALGRVRDGFGRVRDGFGKPLILEMQVSGA